MFMHIRVVLPRIAVCKCANSSATWWARNQPHVIVTPHGVWIKEVSVNYGANVYLSIIRVRLFHCSGGCNQRGVGKMARETVFRG